MFLIVKKFVVYTVLVGDYDDILQPNVVDGRFDYVLFSNDIHSEKVGVWSVRPIPDVVKNDNKRLSRFPKTHPESMLSEYVASLYIDANIQIMDQWVYDRFVELYGNQIEYAGVKLVLTGRDCAYEHAFDMCQNYYDHDYKVIQQCHEMYNAGFPKHFGLNENNVIFRIHTKRMKKVDEEWWAWILNYSFRDQFSYMFCIWKYNIALNYFLSKGEDARNGQHFRLINHDGRQSVVKIKVVKRSLVEKLRIRSKSFNVENSLLNWEKQYKSKHPVLRLYVDGVLSILLNFHKIIKYALLK